MDNLPPDLYELYAQVGIASECAQLIEVEAGNLALAYLNLFLKPGQKVTPEETTVYRAVIEDVNRKTLGTMFRHLRSMATIDPSLLTLMDKALERRNYLTHHFFRTHNFAIQGEAGRAAMLKDLENVTADLRRGYQVLSAMTDSVNHFTGHGKDLAAIVEKCVQRGKSVDI